MIGVSGLSDTHTHTHTEVTSLPELLRVTEIHLLWHTSVVAYFTKITFLWLTYHMGHFYGVLIRHTTPHQEGSHIR